MPETSNHDDPAWQVVKVNDGRSLQVLDYVDGLRDLQDGVLRAIGPAEERFAEDYLRMLRAVRFASRFGFSIESRTAAAIRAHARYLGQISRERIGAELRAMLTGPRPAQSLTLLEQLNLDGPTLHEYHRQSNLKRVQALTELLRDYALANPTISWMTWLMAWVLDRHLPLEETQVADVAALRIAVEHWLATAGNQQLSRLGKALVLTNDDLQVWRDGFKVLPLALGWNELRMAAKKRALASPGWSIAWVLTQTMTHACPSLQRWQAQVEQEISELSKDGLAPIPLVNGDDLIALGRKPGPVFRRLLEQAYDLQLEGQLQSRTQALDWLASQ
ncbi:MAG: CCA tRNA nucleotidyltransferase [Phycisphaerales bacterium]|nr:CCA tRNA nucleotidyltransferase [Phycisphaerales bacterium]